MNCTSCGAQINAGERYCSTCGAPAPVETTYAPAATVETTYVPAAPALSSTPILVFGIHAPSTSPSWASSLVQSQARRHLPLSHRAANWQARQRLVRSWVRSV